MSYQADRQGFYRSNLSGKAEYRSFVPTPLRQVLPLDFSAEQVAKLSACSRMLGEVEGMSRFIPNANLYLLMYIRKEALLSAQIEGTQCTLDDLLDPESENAGTEDVADVVNYIAALNSAIQGFNRLPLSLRLLRDTHSVLMRGVRGAEKDPGHFRTSQNWIGPAGGTLATAIFIPPNPEDMHVALSDLELFMVNERIDPIVKAALVHYQFETVHPFLDGNGRLGRLLIMLLLINDGVLTQIAFYPSFEFKRRRDEYYHELTHLRETGDYERWVAFFCECLTNAARDARASMNAMVELHTKNHELIQNSLGRRSAGGMELLRILEEHPIISIQQAGDKLNQGRAATARLVSDLCDLGIVRLQNAEKQRYRKYIYEEYLDILRSGAEPLR